MLYIDGGCHTLRRCLVPPSIRLPVASAEDRIACCDIDASHPAFPCALGHDTACGAEFIVPFPHHRYRAGFRPQRAAGELNHTRLARNITQADHCRIGLPAHASFIAYDLAFLYLAGLGERVT